MGNRAGIRVVMSCALAKLHNPKVDVRKPYTEIGGDDAFSGRGYDEAYITAFIDEHDLPCNSTTGYLTPALRNIDFPLTIDARLIGKPRKMYQELIKLLDDIYQGRATSEDVLAESIRQLLILRNEQKHQLEELLSSLKHSGAGSSLSAESIVNLIEQHLSFPHASRLPVLIVAAAYNTTNVNLGEQILPLESHNAADSQTGSLGDVDVTIIGDDEVVSSYEMKDRPVTIDDINRALRKLHDSGGVIEHYIFITTEDVEQEVIKYASSIYEGTGMEVVILDCIGFLRYFLHLFHRIRMQYLEEYQKLVLTEPSSSVSPELKQAFLAMRQAAQRG